MNKLKYFFQYLFIIVLFSIFKILGLKYSSNLSGIIVSFIGPIFRSNYLCYSNISKVFEDLTNCNNNINNIEYINVISPYTNNVLSCGFPFYYIHKCLE